MHRPPSHYRRVAAFTLVEVMISLFIVLILLVGVNLVFTTTASTITAGNQLNAIVANARGAQDVFTQDFHHIATDSPIFYIVSDSVAAYQSAADFQAGDRQYGAVDLLSLPINTPTSPILRQTPAPSDRVHRQDIIGFFVRNLMSRQTGGYVNTKSIAFAVDGFSSGITGDEAFVQYCAGKTPTPDLTGYYGPDDVSLNAQQIPYSATTVAPYAADWILSHRRIMLKDPSGVAEPNSGIDTVTPTYRPYYNAIYYDSAGPMPPQWAALNSAPATQQKSALMPLGYGTPDSAPGAKFPDNQVDSSRYDLANITIDQFRQIESDGILGDAKNTGVLGNTMDIWWDPFVYTTPHRVFPPPPPPLLPNARECVVPDGDNHLRYRPRVSPSLVSRAGGGLQPRAAAEMSPFFMQHVSQFVVEYAGDFVSQDNSVAQAATPANFNTNFANATSLAPDGDIDWVSDTRGDWDSTITYAAGDWVIDLNLPTGLAATQPPYFQAKHAIKGGVNPAGDPTDWLPSSIAPGSFVMPQKRIRWYGYPRNLSGANVTPGPLYRKPSASGSPPVVPVIFDEMCDAVPLRDMWKLYYVRYLYALDTQTPPPPPPVLFEQFNPYEVEEPLGDGLPTPVTYITSNLGSPAPSVSAMNDYSIPANFTPLTVNAWSGPPSQFSPTSAALLSPGRWGRYAAVWRNDVPAMVRILIKVDDPNNVQGNGPWFEYVFKLK